MNNPLDHLIARMCAGDAEALEQVFLMLEPELHRVVRRYLTAPLRPKLDPSDIVLTTWADILRKSRRAGWSFTDAGHFRRFLFTVARNRLLDFLRLHRKEIEREEPLDEAQREHLLPSREPVPDEIAQAGELWERIVGLCPPEHVPIVELRREGYTPSEIAALTGLHTDSIRRILRTLARRLNSKRSSAQGESGPVRTVKKSAPASGPKCR